MAELTLNVTKRELFGSLDALDEDDNVFEEYFLSTKMYEKMSGSDRFLILVGEKGTGKSAIIKMCMITDKADGRVVVNIRRPQVEESADINSKVNKWKDLLAGKIVAAIHDEILVDDDSKLTKFVSIAEDLFNEYIKNNYNIDYKKTKMQILDTFLRKNYITIYIDDLDHGYRGTRAQNESIIALFTAIREIMRENSMLRFRVTLRVDVYDNVRCVDESSDKIQDVKLNLNITNHQILAMLTKRVLRFLGKDKAGVDYSKLTQDVMLEKMKQLFDSNFHGIGKWENKPTYNILMTLTRRRPRDLFVLCGLAWEHAVECGRARIMSEDLQAVLNEYSNERFKDAISEYNHEFRDPNDMKELVLGLKLSEKQKKRNSPRHRYTKDELVKKLKNIKENRPIYWQGGKIATEVELVSFLYKANVIIGRVDNENGVRRIYYAEKPNLISDIGNGKYTLEVHPAYRWAIDALDETVVRDLEWEEV